MEGHRGTASMSRGHQTGQARIASTVGPRWFTTRRATRVQPSGVKSSAVHIYVRHLRRSLSSVRQRNYISKWTLMNLLRYRRVCEDSAMNMYDSITFNHVLEKKLRKNKRSPSHLWSHVAWLSSIWAVIYIYIYRTMYNNSEHPNIRVINNFRLQFRKLRRAYFERWVTDCVWLCINFPCINFLRCIIITVAAAYCAASFHRVAV